MIQLICTLDLLRKLTEEKQERVWEQGQGQRSRKEHRKGTRVGLYL